MDILERLNRRINECRVSYGKPPNEKVAYTDDAHLLIDARDTIVAGIRELGRLRQDNLNLVEILARRHRGESDKMTDPDYVYDPDDWEYTMEWAERGLLADDTIRPQLGEIKRFCTLMKGPDKFAAYVLKADAADHGDVELRWFDSEAEARAESTESDPGRPVPHHGSGP